MNWVLNFVTSITELLLKSHSLITPLSIVVYIGTYPFGSSGWSLTLLLLWTIFSLHSMFGVLVICLPPAQHAQPPARLAQTHPTSSALPIRPLNYCLSRLAPSENRAQTLSGSQIIHSAITVFLNHPISLKNNTLTYILSRLRKLVLPGKYLSYLLRLISICCFFCLLILLTSRPLFILFVRPFHAIQQCYWLTKGSFDLPNRPLTVTTLRTTQSANQLFTIFICTFT